jgi:hypothetical protein
MFLAGMLASGEVQRDLPTCARRDDSAGEYTRPFLRRLAREPQRPACWCRVCGLLSLRRLPNQLIARRFEQLRGLLHNLPLGCRRQRNPEVTFQLLQPLEMGSRCRT